MFIVLHVEKLNKRLESMEGKTMKFKSRILTRKQLEALSLAALGLSYIDISTKMHISEKGLKAHISAIHRALGVTRMYQAVAWFYGNDIPKELDRLKSKS